MANRPFNLDIMSDAEYNFLSRRRDSWNTKLICWERLKKLHFSDPKTWTSPKTSKFMALGNLWECLPTEVIHSIFEEMNLTSLLLLRKTNSHFKYLIERWQPFRTIIEHGLFAVRAMVATGADHFCTAPQLAHVIFTTRCELCGEHGEILQLLKVKRCCFKCLATDRKLLVVDEAFAKNPFTMNVAHADLQKVPTLCAMPGQSNFWGNEFNLPQRWLFDFTTALQYSKPVRRNSMNSPSSAGSNDRPISTILRKRAERGEDKIEYYDLHSLNKYTDLVTPDSHQQRFHAAVYLPVLTQTTGARLSSTATSEIQKPTFTKVDASHCRGCRYYWNYISPQHHLTHTLFTASELRTHLETCVYARLWWAKLYPRQNPDTTHIKLFFESLDKNGNLFPRHNHRGNLARSNANVEKMPLAMIDHFRMTANPYQGLYGNYDFDGYKIDGPSAGAPNSNVPLAPITGEDWYGDSLFGDDAVSQASWATARQQSSMCLFQGHEQAWLWRYRKSEANLLPHLRGKRKWGLDTI